MKALLAKLFLFLFSLSACAMTAPDDPIEATDWYQRMERGIEKWATEPNKSDQISNLGDYVFKFGSRMPNHPDPRWHKVFVKAQAALLAIPGHAQYFADEIEREQKAVEPYPTLTGPRVSYDRQRGWHFATLRHLPSPETIAVLGHFLSDDKDTPSELNSPGSDWGENPRANSYFSSGTIMNIGLRNPPVAIQRRNENPDTRLADTRAWWGEIKSGKRTFSFLGQKVEYRFKPDGTWENIALANAPDDAPKAVKSPSLAPTPPAAPAATKGAIPPPGIPWGWITAVVMVVLAGVAWLTRRRSQHGT